ncbi:MAG: GIN domain-containing protein [Blastomonas fulva]|uniref:GIN domain-containing protein n=1 Tax=Blastomonas fulva TaxID=1550728 RepID=UPI0040346473
MKALVIALAALPGCLAGLGSAEAAERRFTLSGFDKVRIEGDVAVEISSDAAPFALASGDPRALEALSLKVQGGTLYIRRARRNAPVEARKRAALPDTLPLVRLSARSVQSLTVLGHGSARIDRLAGARPSATMDGNGSVEIGSVSADAIAINVNGNGSLKVGGTAARARAVMLGEGLIEGGGLTLGALEFIGEGPVRARLTVNGPARIAVKGDADIQIGGKPDCTVRQTGTNAIICGGGVAVR